MLIHRGLHGEYGFDVHGFSILTIGIIPFICVFLLRDNQFRLPVSGLCVLACNSFGNRDGFILSFE